MGWGWDVNHEREEVDKHAGDSAQSPLGGRGPSLALGGCSYLPPKTGLLGAPEPGDDPGRRTRVTRAPGSAKVCKQIKF